MAGRRVAMRHRITRARPRRQITERRQAAIGFRYGEGADVVLLGQP